MSLATATVASPLRMDETGVVRIGSSREEVDAYIAKSDAEAERVHRELELRYPTYELRRRIRERAAQT